MSAAEASPFTTVNRRDAPGENPFKFLDYYDENDEQIFAGRVEEIATILAEFAYGATYVLYGRSGLGKTSLIKAGLIPRMSEIGYLPIYIRILDDPELELRSEVAAKLGLETVRTDEIPDLLANVPRSEREDLDDTTITPVVLIFDQFEEFFIRFREAPVLRKRFAEILGAIARAGGAAVRIVFSLREDYLAELNDLRSHLPDVLTRSHRLLPLTAIGAREAILAILRHYRVPYEDAVPGVLVKELERHRFSPLVLQIYCSEVYEAARRRDPASVHLRCQDVAAAGSVESVYMRYLEAVTAGLASDRVLLACCMLDTLRTAEQTKRALRVQDIAVDASSEAPLPVNFNVIASDAESMLNYLCEKSVVRRLPTEEAWYELLHDGIVPVLTEWLATNKEFRGFRDCDRLVDNLHLMEDSFLSEKQLRQAVEPYQRLLRLTPAEISFLFRSCVFEHGSSISYWAQMYDRTHGARTSNQIIAQAITQPETAVAGLVAAGRVREDELAPLCLTRALQDSNPAVRRVARMSYAQIGAIDHEAIKDARRRHATSRNAIELMADLLIHGHEIRYAGHWTRWRINRVVRQRQVSEGVELIRNRTTIGMLAGMMGAVFVVLGAAPGLYLLLSLDNNFPSVEFALSALGALAGLAVLALYIGRRTAALVAREAVLARSERWNSRAVSLWEIDLAIVGVALLVAIVEPNPGMPTWHWIVHALPIATVGVFALNSALGAYRWVRDSSIDEHNPAARRFSICAVTLGVYAAALIFKLSIVPVTVTATLLAHMLTGPVMRLLQRTVDPTKGMLRLGRRTIQLTYLIMMLPLVIVTLSPIFLLEYPLRSVAEQTAVALILAAVLLSVRAPVAAFLLIWAQKQYPLAAEGLQPVDSVRISRPAVTALRLVIPLTFAVMLAAFGTDSAAIFAEEEKTGTSFIRWFPKYWRRSYYVALVPKNGDVAVVNRLDVTGPAEPMYGSDAWEPIAVTPRKPLIRVVTNSNDLGQGGYAKMTVPELPIRGIDDLRTDESIITIIPGRCRDTRNVVFDVRGTLRNPVPGLVVEVQPFSFVANGRVYQRAASYADFDITDRESPYYTRPTSDTLMPTDGDWRFNWIARVQPGTACRKGGDVVRAYVLAKLISPPADEKRRARP